MLIASAFWIFNKMQKQKGKANELGIGVMNIQEVNEQKPTKNGNKDVFRGRNLASWAGLRCLKDK